MLFNSATYLLFLPTCVAIYWLLPHRYRTHFLLVASYLFYASWSVPYAAMMFGLVVANWWIVLLAIRLESARRTILTVGIVADLLVLGLFKYVNFAFGTIEGIARDLLGVAIALPTSSLILPLGISFFTFEFIHFLVDVRRGALPSHGFAEFHVFSAFFPTQIAGPIKRLQDFLPQIDRHARLTPPMAADALGLIVQGLFKKMALADNLGVIADVGFSRPGDLTFLDAWVAVLAFGFQIYFDFSGYTDIARGSALLFGFSIPLNFRQPYLARNVSDFWERWHISLSRWLRDYLFIPLGGSRVGRIRTARNLLITMLLGGLWHGAAWHFVVWGAYWGAALVAYHQWRRVEPRAPAVVRRALAPAVVRVTLTMVIVFIGWCIFRAPLADAVAILAAMASPGSALHVLTARRALGVLAIAVGYYAWLGARDWLSERQAQLPAPLPGLAVAGLVVLALLAEPGEDPSAFIYFQF